MNFVDSILSNNSRRKEAPYDTPKTRPVATVKPRTVSFRSKPFEKVTAQNGDHFEEAVGEDELYLNQKGFDDEAALPTEEEAGSSHRKVKQTTVQSAICPFEVGYTLSSLPKEQITSYRKKVYDCTLPRLKFDVRGADRMMQSDSEEVRALAYGMRGLMEIMEIQNEKLMSRKSADNMKDVLATLDPNTFLMEPEILIPTLDEQNFISVNNALASVSVQSGSLKSILQVLANQWISVVMPEEDRVLYTTSEKPRPPQTTLPTRFLNSPIELIVKCINVNGVKDSTTSLHVSLFFKLHLSNLFNHSRNSVKQKKRKHRTSEESEHGKDTSGG